MQATFLLGPAGSGKTHRCLDEIRVELQKSPEGLPLVLLAPKQATFQLERQLLAQPSLAGYTRLQILSFERLAEFVLAEFAAIPPSLLDEEGRVMVLRALLAHKQHQLKIFRATARLPGFARQLSLLLRELQRHQHSPERLFALTAKIDSPQLGDKLHDLAVLLRAYLEWLEEHQLQDVTCLQDLASALLRAKDAGRGESVVSANRSVAATSGHAPRSIHEPRATIHGQPATGLGALHFGGLWMDGFAEMTPQELDFLAALMPFCDRATLAFCLEYEPMEDLPWLSTWSLVSRTFRNCHQRLADTAGCEVPIEVLDRRSDHGRFIGNLVLAHLEEHWANPKGFGTETAPGSLGGTGNTAQPNEGSAVRARRAAIPSREMGKAPGAADSTVSPNDSSGVSFVQLELAFDKVRASECMCPPRTADSIRIALCPDPETEAVVAAREILRHVRAGGRYSDCGVLVRTLEDYHDTLRRVFGRYQIPFFLDRRESVAYHPLAELTRYALRTVAFGWEHDDWFGALKTGLVQADEDDIDRLENETLARGWRADAWLRPLKIGGDENLEHRLERARQRLVAPFQQLLERLRAGGALQPSGAQLAEALREFWNRLEVGQTLEKWAESDPSADRAPRAAMDSTVWDQMQSWLDNLALAFPNESLPLREWLPILEAGLTGLTVGVVPAALDQVLIGAIDRSRNPELELAIVLGLNQSVFPATPAITGLLTEMDREHLETRGVTLGPNKRIQLGQERYYGYVAFTRARNRLVLTCAERNAAGTPLNQSAFLGHLQRLFPGLEPETVPADLDWREAEHSSEIVAPLLAGLKGGESGVLRNAIPSSALKFLESLPVFGPPLHKQRQLAAARGGGSLSPELAEQLYGRELRTSVSALENFAACPFKFFAARGLRAEERKEFEVDPRARGEFQHKILQQFHLELERGGRRWRDLSPAEARERIGRIGEELLRAYREGLFLADEARRFTARELIAGTQRLIEALVAWMPQYRFDPSRAEVTFGLDGQGLPPWRIELAHGHALVLRGRIDRVDLCRLRESGETLAVVIDYKSRPRSLDSVKLQNGLELQLLSYLGALRHVAAAGVALDSPGLLPAGAFYVNLKPKRGSGRTRTEARANSGQAIRRGFQHTGRFNADWLSHFDNRGQPRGDQFKYAINKAGEFARRGNDALEAGAFQRLLTEVEQQGRRIGEAIYHGDVSVAPFRKGSETACDFCEFRAICRFDSWVQSYRFLRPAQGPLSADSNQTSEPESRTEQP